MITLNCNIEQEFQGLVFPYDGDPPKGLRKVCAWVFSISLPASQMSLEPVAGDSRLFTWHIQVTGCWLT